MSDTLERLRTALTGRYDVERELGRGGMATVYLAQDRKHMRRVAIKVLRPELAAAVGDERFLREIQVTAGLRHPHILPLLDSGAADGLLYYVMPYVEGESIRDRLSRERQLPIDDAVAIATEVLSALGYAHSHDVVHRDIKPENILLESGHAVVADFGIARAVDAAGGAQLTETGIAVGTPAYMSPEQATGEATPDGRSDLYSLGCVLYEMLAGEPPYAGPTVQAITARKLTEPTPSVLRVRETVPEALAEVIERLLAKLPADRFAGAAHAAEELRRAATGRARAGSPPPKRTVGERRPAVPVPRWLMWTTATIVVALSALGVRGLVVSEGRGEDAPTRLSVVLPEGIRLLRLPGPILALSPDGRTLVVVGTGSAGQQLFVRHLDTVEPRALDGTEGAASPFFSPDGEWIGFYAEGQLKRVPVTGGAPLVITEAPGEPLGASWGPDDRIVFTTGYRSGLRRVSAGGAQ